MASDERGAAWYGRGAGMTTKGGFFFAACLAAVIVLPATAAYMFNMGHSSTEFCRTAWASRDAIQDIKPATIADAERKVLILARAAACDANPHRIS